MPNTRYYRTLSAFSLALITLLPFAGSTLEARGRHSYHLRGNPEETKRVSKVLLAEKLPDLAALVGIDPIKDTVVAASTAVQEKTTHAFIKVDAFKDAELDESEDPDRITAEDEKNLQEVPDDINAFRKEFTSYMASLNGDKNITDNGLDKQVVMETVMDWIGTHYLFGGVGRSGIDCSAFTGTVYRALNFKLPRTAAAQWDAGTPVNNTDLQFGDLIFFHTRKCVYVSHVGMYLGNGMFVHASSRNGVTVSSLDADYYATHMIGARRFNLANLASGSGEDGVAH